MARNGEHGLKPDSEEPQERLCAWIGEEYLVDPEFEVQQVFTDYSRVTLK